MSLRLSSSTRQKFCPLDKLHTSVPNPFNALVEDYPADHLRIGHEIALDDVAVCFPLRDMSGSSCLVTLIHGNLLYTAWALSLVTALASEKVLLRGLSRFFLG
jgi:hypothetical protein